MRIASDCTHSVTLALQQLQTLSRYRLKKLGFVDSNPVNVAVAAIRVTVTITVTTSHFHNAVQKESLVFFSSFSHNSWYLRAHMS